MSFDATIRSRSWLRAHSQNLQGHLLWAAVAAGIEMLMISASAYGAFIAYNRIAYGSTPIRSDYGIASVTIGAVYGGLCLIDNQYDVLGDEWSQLGRSRGLATVAAAFVLLLAVGFLTDDLTGYSRGTFVVQLAVAALAQVVTRTILWQFIYEARKRKRWQGAGRVMLIMPGVNWTPEVRRCLSMQCDDVLKCYELDYVPSGLPVSFWLESRLEKIKGECRALQIGVILIVFDADNMNLVTRVASALSELPARLQLLPAGMTDLMQRSRIAPCGRLNVLELFCGPCSLRDRLLKRSMDFVAAIVLGVLTGPLLVIIAMLIKLDSKGPVLFRQTRHGFNNEPIQVLKFRTMVTSEDEGREFRQAIRNDRRITRVGRMLRRTNLDELPQLFNVLKGEMSMVGPRPHAVAHNEMYVDRIRGMWRRHNVKPGITGWAQVNGFRGETDTIEKMQKRIDYDLYYVANWSLMFDFKIMVMTLVSKQAYANAY